MEREYQKRIANDSKNLRLDSTRGHDVRMQMHVFQYPDYHDVAPRTNKNITGLPKALLVNPRNVPDSTSLLSHLSGSPDYNESLDSQERFPLLQTNKRCDQH